MSVSHPVRVIAFYLPQFHTIPENDEWWGPGFTEWTNVKRARPLYDGHDQPRLPGELGYYDLRERPVRHRQAELARDHGIYGFCYYFYWFSGRRLLETPLELMLADQTLDFPFCICWANENWSRRWDGSDHDILMAQTYAPEDPDRLIRDLLPCFTDSRYITVDGAPLLAVYRPAVVPDLPRVVSAWRASAARLGIPRLHICGVQTFGYMGGADQGLDALVEFPPHDFCVPEITSTIAGLDPAFSGKIFSYADAVDFYQRLRLPEDLPVYRGVMARWDNSARRGLTAYMFWNATPNQYETWLKWAVDYASEHHRGDHRLVFVNAWNEWAEGTYLEPDVPYGDAYLQATARAVLGVTKPTAPPR